MPNCQGCKYFILDVDDNTGHCYQATPQTYFGSTTQVIQRPRIDKDTPACGNFKVW